MPKPVKLPFPPLVLVDLDGPIKAEEVQARVGPRLRKGVSICVRSQSGPEKRGGYFFHPRLTDEGYLSLSTFDAPDVVAFSSLAELVQFMNHASGRTYSEEMWQRSQLLNLRSDPSEDSD